MTVILPTKTDKNCRVCLEAVRKREPNANVIVVDDGLMSRPWVQDWCNPGLRTLFIDGVKPFIYARNCNLGIQAAADDVVLLNDDAVLETPEGFRKLKEFADAHPDVGIVAPATNITGQKLQWPKHRTPEGFRFVDQVPFVCVYIPRRTLERVGLLDERYCLDYGVEDRDYCEAVKRAGMKIAIVYDVYVDHGSLRSSFRGDPKAPKSFQRNFVLFKQKWGIR